MFTSRFMPCPDCGDSVDRSAVTAHRCRRERWVEYQMFGLRDDVARFETRLRSYLHTATGRFEVWLAARHVRRGIR